MTAGLPPSGLSHVSLLTEYVRFFRVSSPTTITLNGSGGFVPAPQNTMLDGSRPLFGQLQLPNKAKLSTELGTSREARAEEISR